MQRIEIGGVGKPEGVSNVPGWGSPGDLGGWQAVQVLIVYQAGTQGLPILQSYSDLFAGDGV